MKIFIYLFFVSVFVYAGCKSDDTTVTPITPAETEMASFSLDSISASFAGGTVTQTKNFGTGALNFSDRDSTRLSFSYKGASTVNDTLFYITDASNTRLYTLRDAAVNDTYKSVNVTVPSIKVNAIFYYTMKAKTSGSVVPYLAIKDFKMYKK